MRQWTAEEFRLMEAIGRRLADGLTALLTLRDLQASEARYRRIIDTANEGIWALGPDETTEFVNARMAELIGCTPDELLRHRMSDFILDEDRADHGVRMEHRRRGLSETYERRFRRQDGAVVWAQVSATPIFDADGRFQGSFGMFTDITERRRAEAELRESEARFRALYNRTPAMLHSIGKDGRLISVSDHWLATLGYTRDEVIGRRSTEFLTEASQRHAADVVVPEFMRRGEVRNVEYQFVRKDGSVLDGLLSATSERDANGDVLRSLAVTTDITDRKRAEVELTRLNRALRAISDCNQVLLRATDEHDLMRDVCRIICDEAGYRLAWVAYATDEAPRLTSVVVVEQGDTEGAGAGHSRLDLESESGPAALAARSGATVVGEDRWRPPGLEPWLAHARALGYRSVLAMPLRDEHRRVFGVLLIGSAEVNAFRDEERQLLEELAGDLALGASVLRARERQAEAERSIALLSFALNSVREAAFLLDETGRFLYVNDEACRVLGYDRDALLCRSVTDVDPDMTPEAWRRHWCELMAQRALLFEGHHRTCDGRVFPVEISANYIEYRGARVQPGAGPRHHGTPAHGRPPPHAGGGVPHAGREHARPPGPLRRCGQNPVTSIRVP